MYVFIIGILMVLLKENSLESPKSTVLVVD